MANISAIMKAVFTSSVWQPRAMVTGDNFHPKYLSGLDADNTAGVTLIVDSSQLQRFTGASNQTVVLPVTTTLVLGMSYIIDNTKGTGIITVNSSGGNLVVTVNPSEIVTVYCILVTGTTAASWDTDRVPNLIASAQVTTFLAGSATLNTYTVTGCSLTLPAGNWLIFWAGVVTGSASGGTGAAVLDLSLVDNSATPVVLAKGGGPFVYPTVGVFGSQGSISNQTLVSITASTTYRTAFSMRGYSGAPIGISVSADGTATPLTLYAIRVHQ